VAQAHFSSGAVRRATAGGPGGHQVAGWDGVRLRAARIAALAASAASRAAGLGSGTAIGGRIALAMAPQALAGLSRGRVLACVCGTNGKTTTTRLLAAAVGVAQPVISNSSGANLPSGLVSVLCRHPDRPAVLEVDELYLATAIRSVAPSVVVLLNLSRDQLDRTAEAQRAAIGWRQALAAGAGPEVTGASGDRRGPTVVANCDDPRLVWAASVARRVVWVAAGQAWTADSQVCPGCGHPLRSGASPRWACTSCGLHRPTPDATLTDQGLELDGRSVPVELQLPGRVNRANAVMAAVAAAQLGLPIRTSLAAMRDVAEVEGRYAEQVIDGRRCRLLLAKNPAGWAATMDLVQRNGRSLLLSVNAQPVDGRDTSWLYDVPFEQLVGRRLVVSGAAGADLSLRLGYAGVQHRLVSDHRAAMAALGPDAAPTSQVIDAVGDYSSFQQLRRLAVAAR
jgi:lipid II isoglutaminyl synthase (glutamine-hydrolysing)